jgi:hypothetical protein
MSTRPEQNRCRSRRGFLNSSSVHHIDAFERLFLEPKKFEFDREFFGSGVLNSIIDGYEPLLDIIWNAVKIALHGPGLQGETAYAVALSVVPSFLPICGSTRTRNGEASFRS